MSFGSIALYAVLYGVILFILGCTVLFTGFWTRRRYVYISGIILAFFSVVSLFAGLSIFLALLVGV